MTVPLPPLVYGPIYSTVHGQTPVPRIHVGNVLPGAVVTIYAQASVSASAVQVGQGTSVNGGDIWIPLTQVLTAKTLVSATQKITEVTSASSNLVLVMQLPKIPPAPVFLSPLETCMGAIRLGNLIQDCTIHITNSAGTVVLQTVVSQPVGSEQSFDLPSTPAVAAALTAGTTLTAWQTFEGVPSPTTSGGPVITTTPVAPNKPVIGPVWPCQTAIYLSNLNPGTDLLVNNKGTETLFSNTYKDLELFLVAPLVPGTLAVTQHYRRCPHIPTSLPGNATVVERPLPPLSISYAASNVEALSVSGVVPGEILSVYQDIQGAPPQLLGEQQVTGEPATVNLPSISPAVLNGTSGSLSVSGALCNNTPPAQATATPALPPSLTLPFFGQPFGGDKQYFLWGGPASRDKLNVPLLGLIVDIAITEDIVVAPNSPAIGFQVNGYSQKHDNTIGWQQFAVRMSPPGSNQLDSVAENWPPGYPANQSLPNVFQLPSANSITLPNNTTIPSGWTIRIEFQYYQQGALISGYNCSVVDATGTQVGSNLNIALLGQQLAAGGPIQESDLARFVAFQVVLVGWWNKAQATLMSGAGTITYKSTTPLLAIVNWPGDTDGVSYTIENTNSTYGLMPAQASTHIVQSFGVTS